MRGYEVKLIVDDFNPNVLRDLTLPENFLFSQLHEVIQICFDFLDMNPHYFSIPNSDVIIQDLERFEPFGDNVLDSEEVEIKEFFNDNRVIHYNYDIENDGWLIRVEVSRKLLDCFTVPFLRYQKGDWNMLDNIGGHYAWEYMVYGMERYPNFQIKELVEKNVLEISDVTPTKVHEEYQVEFAEFNENTLKFLTKGSDEYYESLENFNLKFIQDKGLLEDFNKRKSQGFSLNEYIDEFVKTYEDYTHFFKIKTSFTRRYLMNKFNRFTLSKGNRII